MFKTKKDVDRHVRTALSKLHSENEKNLRGFTIAKLYFKIQEYATAQHYVSTYISANEGYAPAHRLLGQCLLQLKKPDKALEAFQRSLDLDPKQPDLLIEVCKMLLSDESSTSLNKAKFWCDLAESENVQDNAVFSLRLKLLNKSSLETTEIESLILKEISSKPTDPNLRVRMVKHFIEQNKVLEAFKYAYDLEMNNHNLFLNCIDWYNIVWLALSKYRQLPSSKKSWDYWLLSMICIERQVDLSFANMNNNALSNGGTTDIANLLFTFDQHLFEAAKCVSDAAQQKELAAQFLYHFRGQLCLHAAALIFRREQVQNKNHWREATKTSLPMLFFAFHCGTSDTKESWLKHSGEKVRQLIQTWNREGAFRCAQAGRTILSCIDNNKDGGSLSSQVHNVISDQNSWSSADDILSQIRQQCSDNTWRTKLFRTLFPNSDQLIKIQSSYLVVNEQLAEPIYELPKRSEIEAYEEIAQYLRPQSLQHMVYLCLGMDSLCDVRCNYFSGLNFSTQNLAFCGAESLTRLDMETFLCAATIQTKRSFEVERIQHESYNAKNVGKPRILPFANVFSNLCTESQSNWWKAAYQVYKNLTGDNLAELRATLQYGIEAVRGISGPKMDLIIILRLGKMFGTRAQDASKPIEKTFLEARAITLYKYGLMMLKLHNKGVLEPFRKLFKFANGNNAAIEREMNSLAEEAVSMLAARYFKAGDYEECIEEFAGIQLPYATYYQAEAYRKLDESNKTPKKTKKFYSDKAKDCLDQTLQLLSFSNDKNHPLKSIVQSEMKRTQYNDTLSNNEHLNDIENREEFFNESFNTSRTQRDLQASILVSKTTELENLIKQMMNTLTFVKEEIVDSIKPELSEIKERVFMLEENMKKKSGPPSRDDATRVFDDLYIIGDDLQQVMLSQYNQQQQQTTPQQRMQTPNALLNQAPPSMLHNPQIQPAANIYNSPLYNPIAGNLPNNFVNQQHHQYNTPGTASNVYNTPPYNSNYPFNYYSQIVMPPGVMSLGMQSSQHQQQQPLTSQAESNPSLYDILSLTATMPNVQQSGDKITVEKSAAQPSNNTSGMWNRPLNVPIEKAPPVNVVITSSDPLPAHTVVSTQSTLSVTIPPHHIKPSVVPSDWSGARMQQKFNLATTVSGSSAATLTTTGGSTATPTLTGGISFAPPKASITELKPGEKLNESAGSDVYNKSGETEYEPQVEFQPVIPLPDEIEVKTGEEDEDVMFCSRGKLLRLIEKEWKERGIGDIKILKSKNDGKIRILMRREQTHKMCANHYLTPELKLMQAKGDEKSFIWCVDDFADEVMKREKLCVRFKQVETAKEFQKVFLQAQEELRKKDNQPSTGAPPGEKSGLEVTQSKDAISIPTAFGLSKSSTFNFSKTNTSTPKSEPKGSVSSTTVDSNKDVTTNAPSSVFGKLNFGFSNSDAAAKDAKQPETSKPSPFASFTFSATTGTKTDSPFANIFSKTMQSVTEQKSPASAPVQVANKSNTAEADADDDYVPTAEFKPVIPLPDLVEVQTGEENEDVLFEHRAKLLRFDKSTGEWKERGIGIMKILVDKNDVNRVRLVMRREQIFKLCCNQRLMKDTVFQNAQNSTNALTWVGQDYSENELQSVVLAIRFKTADICKEFHNAILKAQERMTEGGAEGHQNETTKSNEIKGKDSTDKKGVESETGFGDKFKSKPGSWSCNSCYISNNADTLYCVACEGPKDDTVPKKSSFGAFNAPAKNTFTFGFGTITNAQKQPDSTKPPVEGFGDKFKPKAGSWSCQSCYVSNESSALYCSACESPKDDTVPKKEPVNNIFAPSANAPKFQFGFAPTAAVDLTKNAASSAAINSVSAVATIEAPSTNRNPFDLVTSSGFIFGAVTPTASTKNVFSTNSDGRASFTLSPFSIFDVKNDNSNSKLTTSKSTVNSSQKAITNSDGFGQNEFKLEKEQFNFTFAPKSPGKAKSPAKNLSGVDDDDDNVEEEENNTYFTPVIPLPDKVDVVTGEEDEEQLYCHRAKLYRFVSGEWKERGIGDVKILRHKDTKKLRVVMRREKIHKICLNHALTPDIEYKPKDEKSWHFAANDFSEGEFQSTVFSIRFKNKEIAKDFMEAVKKALEGSGAPDGHESGTTASTKNPDLSDDLIKLADRLKLPYSFFQYDESKKCPGCRGCDPDNFKFPDYSNQNELVDNSEPIPLVMPHMQTPSKPILKQSILTTPKLTPKSENNQIAKNIFGTANMFSSPDSMDTSSKTSASNAFDKFSFTLGESKPASGGEGGENKFSSGGFLFGNALTFGNLDKATPIFGQCAFGNTVTSSASTQSIFGGSISSAIIFGGTNNSALPSSTYATISDTITTSQSTATTDSQANLFGSLNLTSKADSTQQVFDGKPNFTFATHSFGSAFGNRGTTGGSIFGGNAFGAVANSENTMKAADSTGNITNDNNTQTNNKENEPKGLTPLNLSEPIFKNDPGLSFASLAANADSQAGFKIAGKSDAPGGFIGLKKSDFSIFLTSGKDDGKEKVNTSEDGAGQGDDSSYDPHYDPVIELPKLITVSTGEEEEEKLFGERGVLYRFDTTNKEWKERGTGEVKILHHPDKGTYRLLLRREQVHKLVLNHAIAADFQLKPMNASGKSYCWGAMNYAENPPVVERLAVRFKNTDIAKRFENEVLSCVEKAKQRSADLEPEED